MVKRLHKASVGYPDWKLLNNPNYKPWHYPEQIMAPRIRIEEVRKLIFVQVLCVHARAQLILHASYYIFIIM